jgi:hypothetical protein
MPFPDPTYQLAPSQLTKNTRLLGEREKHPPPARVPLPWQSRPRRRVRISSTAYELPGRTLQRAERHRFAALETGLLMC